jgi:ABC-type lipoprotein release transport system permease subunit
MGVLLGIVGGVLGTYVGMVTAWLCHFFAPRVG